MITTSEVVVTATIWALTAAGGFFGVRATLRRKKLKSAGKKNLAGIVTINVEKL